jgi:hypothetical protein
MWEAVMLVLLIAESINYTAEIVSNALIYVPSFIKIGWGIKKLSARYSHTDTDTESKVIS